MSRLFPDAFREQHVQLMAPFFRTIQETLLDHSPNSGGAPHIVLLTPGRYNETYFEHAYLSRYLGFTLVKARFLSSTTSFFQDADLPHPSRIPAGWRDFRSAVLRADSTCASRLLQASRSQRPRRNAFGVESRVAELALHGRIVRRSWRSLMCAPGTAKPVPLSSAPAASKSLEARPYRCACSWPRRARRSGCRRLTRSVRRQPIIAASGHWVLRPSGSSVLPARRFATEWPAANAGLDPAGGNVWLAARGRIENAARLLRAVCRAV